MKKNMNLDTRAITTGNLDEFSETITDLTNAGQWTAGIIFKDLTTQAADSPINAAEIEKLCKCDYETTHDTCSTLQICHESGAGYTLCQKHRDSVPARYG